MICSERLFFSAFFGNHVGGAEAHEDSDTRAQGSRLVSFLTVTRKSRHAKYTTFTIFSESGAAEERIA